MEKEKMKYLNFKILVELLVILCLVVVFTGFANGYKIDMPSMTNPESVFVKKICGYHVITENGDLKTKIIMSFVVGSNFWDSPFKPKNLTFYFWLGTVHEFYPPANFTAINFSISICETHTGHEECDPYFLSDFSAGCIKPYNPTFLPQDLPHEVTFIPEIPEQTEGATWFIFSANYTLPNFTFEQGSYHIAWLDTQGKDTIVLPSEDSVPRFLPDYTYITRINERESKTYRWAFTFKEGGQKIIWYVDEKELKENERKLQDEYTWKGVFLGAVVSVIVGIIFLFAERKLKLFSERRWKQLKRYFVKLEKTK